MAETPLLDAWINVQDGLVLNLTYQAKVFYIPAATTVQFMSGYGGGIMATGNNAVQVVKYATSADALAAYTRIEAAIQSLRPIIQVQELILTSLAPSSGVSPGDTVTITGTGFTVERDLLQVLVGSANAGTVTFIDNSHISFIAPPNTVATTYDVKVTRTQGGDNKTLSASLTYA